MKKYFLNVSILASTLLLSFGSFAYRKFDEQGGKPSKGNGSLDVTAKSANCAPRTAVLLMDFNNVSTILQQGGLLYREIGGQQNAAYEVPKGSGLKAIYAGSLWMGGVDVNGQLKLAAVRFQQNGHDFWPGPLTVSPGSGNYNPNNPVGDDAVRDFGEANIDPDVCLEYDRFFTIRRGEVERYSLWYECDRGLVEEGCDDVQKPTNEEMNRINNWPAHGDQSRGQDFYLAPFYDRNGDGAYEPLDGDYPWYDDILGRDDVECGIDRRITLFGDETHWWIFNDKGNIHGESGGDPIGMEIRAQAFAFGTNDEINNMTFYNYELINRGTQTLFDTYFSQYIDADLGNFSDDYVGCDVARGLGYAFNGDALDESDGSAQGYGANPPAIGVDFFEGPYQDADEKDNLGPVFDSVTKQFVPPSVNDAIADGGIVYRGIGTGYADGIVDNERFGMRRFSFYTNGASFPYTDPQSAAQYYNFMQGFWADGSLNVFGGQGYAGSEGATTIECQYMFPGDSDPLYWATEGVNPGFTWDESTNNNPSGDRRFVQSAGPFTLEPGAVNNITVGIVYGRGSDGDLFSSVRAIKRADTKAQALFDNCFRILNPPDAPRLTIQELENELILMLDNPASSNNFREQYEEEDKINIVEEGVDKFYRFEGYQIFQLKDGETSISDISDITKARLVAQCDIRNFEKDENGKDILSKPISRLINFEFDEALGFSVPVEKVAGSNTGIKHSFQIKEDLFAQGDRALVNHKTYYYVAIAYAYNNFAPYDPSDPLLLNGQKTPYLASRIGFDKKEIAAVSAIPHDPAPESGGTVTSLEYGSSPRITRVQGHGNGGRILELAPGVEMDIVNQGSVDAVTYDFGAGPIDVKVIDPVNLKEGYFECLFTDYTNTTSASTGADTAEWVINRYESLEAKNGGALPLESVSSEVSIDINNEQLIPDWGVSVQINQKAYFFEDISGNISNESTELLDVTLTYGDSSKQWLSVVNDVDGFNPQNWIRAGIYSPASDDPAYDPNNLFNDPRCYNDEVGLDPDKRFAGILGGGIAPHRLVGYQCDFMPLAYYKNTPSYPNGPETPPGSARTGAGIAFSPSIDLVITSDKSLWTRCPVIELGRDQSLNIGNAKPGSLRASASVDKDGNPLNDGTTGIGWFPGYAIDLETGARLQMAFGENSFLGADNGGDMIWNPSSRLYSQTGSPRFGGMHAIYVFSHNYKKINGLSTSYDMPAYNPATQGQELIDLYAQVTSGDPLALRNVYSSLSWVGFPVTTPGSDFFGTDARIRIRVSKEYKTYDTGSGFNEGRPVYSWDMSDIATKTGDQEKLAEVLDKINVVPNPYYAFSDYERGKLDTRVKITNLPERCDVRIYSTNGKLVRSYEKDDNSITSLDWDLNNFKGIPVASGVYLIHVSVPGVGDRVVKFYGAMREVDFQGI